MKIRSSEGWGSRSNNYLTNDLSERLIEDDSASVHGSPECESMPWLQLCFYRYTCLLVAAAVAIAVVFVFKNQPAAGRVAPALLAAFSSTAPESTRPIELPSPVIDASGPEPFLPQKRFRLWNGLTDGEAWFDIMDVNVPHYVNNMLRRMDLKRSPTATPWRFK